MKKIINKKIKNEKNLKKLKFFLAKKSAENQ